MKATLRGLEFCLDHGRIHIGDVGRHHAGCIHGLGFRPSGWARRDHDRPHPEPRRRTERPCPRASSHPHTPAASEVVLADGNRASVGDVIITRANDRRLRLTATDWVKNGDRWTITAVSNNGGITVRHNRSHLTVRCPPTTSTLPPASAMPPPSTQPKASPPTPCTAWQLDRSHASSCTPCSPEDGPPTTSTFVVGDGDPHTVIRPETAAPARRPRCCSRSSLATTHVSQHAAARAQRPSCPAVRRRSALHRRAPSRG